jgi:predicted dehydrogenase
MDPEYGKGHRKTPMSSQSGIDRRQFLAGSAGALLLAMLGAEEVRAETKASPAAGAAAGAAAPAGPPVRVAVIGLGMQGRALLQSLARIPGVTVVSVCDNYAAAHKRALEVAPQAAAVTDYRQVLDNKDVDAVFIATPSHLHREIAVAAVAAGKHVYCEAPLAHTIEDARAIALAGLGSKKVFQGGLMHRADPITVQVRKFVDADAMGKIAQVRAQYHKRNSWRRTAPNAEREKALNWRLSKSTSPGLVGEYGIHSIDVGSWYLGKTPVAVTGMGGILAWDDGRDVPDTAQCIIEYPGGVRLVYDATLANSFEGDYELFMGTDSAIYMKDGRAWMVKEADASALGWEVYARKEKVGDEVGIALVADATKQLELGKEPGKQAAPTALSEQSMVDNLATAFLKAIRGEEDAAGAGPKEAYEATVTALKANEAVNTNARIVFQKEWFELA